MNTGYGIPQKDEEAFRAALNHAGHKRVDELRSALDRMTDQQIATAVRLCGFVSAYTVIDVVNRRWPTDEGVRLIAEKTARSAGANAWPGVTEQNLHLFLSRCALGFEDFTVVLNDAFPDADDLLMAPFFLTIQLLGTFGPSEQSISAFLDVVEDAYEKAWQLDLNLLPALMVRARMPQPGKTPDSAAGNK